MPYSSDRALHTDQNPNDPNFSGQVLEAGDPTANFVLVGKGGTVSDADAKRWGLIGRDGISVFDSEQAKADREAKNKATYGDGSALTVVPPSPDETKATAAAIEADKAPQPPVEHTADNPSAEPITEPEKSTKAKK